MLPRFSRGLRTRAGGGRKRRSQDDRNASLKTERNERAGVAVEPGVHPGPLRHSAQRRHTALFQCVRTVLEARFLAVVFGCRHDSPDGDEHDEGREDGDRDAEEAAELIHRLQ